VSFNSFSEQVARLLPETLRPVTLYAFRGLCYAAFANRQSDRIAAFLASPGRLACLRLFLSRTDIERLEYPKDAYRDLLEELPLPHDGYRFGQFDTFLAHELSDLTLHLAERQPLDALKEVIRLRASDEARKLKDNWSDRLWASSETAAIGRQSNRQFIQVIKGTKISGSVSQIIHATPVA
jgi:hypothetical protein